MPRYMESIPNTEEEFTTVQFDPRFPNQNQTKHCYQHYLDFHRCAKARGETFEACKYFKFAYMTMCPRQWHQKWDEQREAGIFPGRI